MYGGAMRRFQVVRRGTRGQSYPLRTQAHVRAGRFCTCKSRGRPCRGAPEHGATPLSTTEQTIEAPVHEPSAEADQGPILTFELSLSEAEALRAWLLKPAQDGTTSLDEPNVSRVLTKVGMAVDAVVATTNVRRELLEAGLAVDHLTDEEVRELGRRVAQAAAPAMRV